jgi:hypothetical protein
MLHGPSGILCALIVFANGCGGLFETSGAPGSRTVAGRSCEYYARRSFGISETMRCQANEMAGLEGSKNPRPVGLEVPSRQSSNRLSTNA